VANATLVSRGFESSGSQTRVRNIRMNGRSREFPEYPENASCSSVIAGRPGFIFAERLGRQMSEFTVA